ncbi:hypothetical protein TNCV_1753471 [Trichonephila clavipes]|nr:hypothetical protein TNCV_1753471 [Trichonephila clavipes]
MTRATDASIPAFPQVNETENPLLQSDASSIDTRVLRKKKWKIAGGWKQMQEWFIYPASKVIPRIPDAFTTEDVLSLVTASSPTVTTVPRGTPATRGIRKRFDNPISQIVCRGLLHVGVVRELRGRSKAQVCRRLMAAGWPVPSMWLPTLWNKWGFAYLEMVERKTSQHVVILSPFLTPSIELPPTPPLLECG